MWVTITWDCLPQCRATEPNNVGSSRELFQALLSRVESLCITILSQGMFARLGPSIIIDRRVDMDPSQRPKGKKSRPPMTHNAASGKGRSLVKAKGGSSPQTTRQRAPFLSREGPKSVLDVASSRDTCLKADRLPLWRPKQRDWGWLVKGCAAQSVSPGERANRAGEILRELSCPPLPRPPSSSHLPGMSLGNA